MADRFRGVVRGGLDGEELAEPFVNRGVPVAAHPPSKPERACEQTGYGKPACCL